MFTYSVKVSVSRELPDVVIFDEVIAEAIAEEKSATDGSSQATETLTQYVNTAKNHVTFEWAKKTKIFTVTFK